MATATTYNRSQITKSAWTLVKTQGLSLSQAMKQAWAEAKTPKVDFVQFFKRDLTIEQKLYLTSLYNSFADRNIDGYIAIDFSGKMVADKFFEVLDFKSDKVVFSYETNQVAIHVGGKKIVHSINN